MQFSILRRRPENCQQGLLYNIQTTPEKLSKMDCGSCEPYDDNIIMKTGAVDPFWNDFDTTGHYWRTTVLFLNNESYISDNQ